MKNIRFISPSGPFSLLPYEEAVTLLQTRGYGISLPASLRKAHLSYLNGDDKSRLAELSAALSQEHDIVWAVRGGYGLTRILPDLHLAKHARLPLVVGCSDASALLAHLWQVYGCKSIHGPLAITLAKEPSASQESLWAILEGRAKEIKYPPLKLEFAPSGAPSVFSGRIVAMNLTVLCHLIGTVSMPCLQDAILLLEDVGERPYKLDRMLTQLWHSGALRGVKAVVIGHLTRCQEKDPDDPFLVCVERCASFQIPVLSGLPMGHEQPNYALPFGVLASLHIDGDSALLQIDEEIHD